MDKNWMQKLADVLQGAGGSGSGVQGAAQALGGRAYQLYAAEARANGQAPVTPQQFAAGQLQQAAPVQQPVEQPLQPFRF